MGTPEEGEEGLLMDIITGRDGDVDNWKEVMLIYGSALKQIGTKLEILNDEFQHVHSYNPIEHIKMRIKSMQSIMDKLERKNIPYSFDNVMANINDIAGIRVICSFTSDIYKIAKMLASQNDMNVLEIKDYIKNPKPNGYRSLHQILEIPVFLKEGKTFVKVEVQFRTIAMDFWASVDHKLRYKKNVTNEEEIMEKLRICADSITAIDEEMQKIRNMIEA